VIAQVGPQGEPLQPIEIISRFSNPCSCIVREKVPITYENWKLVPKDLKGVVWGEMMRRFTYPDGSNLDKCEAHVMYLAGKVLRNFIYRLNREYVQTGKNPCARYNYVLPEVWEAFVKQKQTPEAKAKGEQFSKLAKRNVHHHHLGMTGYATKKPKWRAEERATNEAGQPDPYDGIDERARDYLKARKPKKL